MKCRSIFSTNNKEGLKPKIIDWLRKFNVACILDSHTKVYPAHKFAYSNFDFIAAAGVHKTVSANNGHSLNELDNIINSSNEWHFGFFSYDLKNQFEQLSSNNTDNLNWPDFYFFSPQILLFVNEDKIEIQSQGISPEIIWKDISASRPASLAPPLKTKVNARLDKKEYLERVEALRKHILRGNIYEINFCQEYFSYTDFEPYYGYQHLNLISPTPFSTFFRLKDKYLLSASPERYLKKTGNKLISQPIKGTARKGTSPLEDTLLVNKLSNSKKERAENIMIVDLVRNDLSKIATDGSVKVEELCGIYSFKQVHQMISTISAISKTHSIKEILEATFPMGSMTGAPKISAMILAEQYETSRRGLYSGAVGYITPDKDFDFNVVIRSLQYNAENSYLSFMVGGAITYLSNAKEEYEECLLKASAINTLLNPGDND